nr:hypothetical protein Iba_chr02eCG8360 [Ipomoea batatas]
MDTKRSHQMSSTVNNCINLMVTKGVNNGIYFIITIRSQVNWKSESSSARRVFAKAPSYIATVEALRHISIAGDMAEERGESNDYTNVINDQEFMYEPIPQVRGPDRRRDVNRRGRPPQGGHRRRHVPPREVEENVDLEDNIDHIENQHGGDDDIGDTNTMGGTTQNDFSQALGALIPYVAQFGDCDPGSSSQAGSSSYVPPQHEGRLVRSPSHAMPNDPFSHVIQQWYTDEDQDGTQNSQVDIMNSNKPEGKITPKRMSRRLAEITRQEMLRARRAANGGHEV